MNALKTLNAQLAEVRQAQTKESAALGDIAAERFELGRNHGGKAARIIAAEADLIEQLARRELDESSDVPSAEKVLADSKASPDDGFERATRLRVLATLEQRHTDKYAELHEKSLIIMGSIKTAEVEAINTKVVDILIDAEVAMVTLARAGPMLAAASELLAERGQPWKYSRLNEPAIAFKNTPTPNAARAEILSALAS